jgi:hypothetical protein
MNFMFNLEDYETVEDRLAKFWKEHEDGRIETTLVESTLQRFIVKASIYRTEVDAQAWTTGFAEETVSTRGVNSTSALENCETSAIGRALANAGYASKGKRPSREEMSKVKASEPKPFAEKLADKITMPAEDDPWTTKAVGEAPSSADAIALVQDVLGAVKVEKEIPLCRNCHDHKPMSWKTGVSAKTKKPWANFNCFACKDVIWYEIKSDGSWGAQENKW